MCIHRQVLVRDLQTSKQTGDSQARRRGVAVDAYRWRAVGWLFWCGLTFVSAWVPVKAEDPFAALIRPTDPLSPLEQQSTFQVPPGFVVELVAAEPDILKPLNMAFDSRGRLWVTVTQEYPYAAPPNRPGRDALMLLEDTDADGRFDKIATFADQLNIPIGVYPYRRGAIVFSIPHIWYLEDSDGDDRADRRTILYGPMGYERDTHGMNNAFRRGFDGWLYACHGFNNETRVAGADGHQIYMHSGNTYRMRVDGQRIEHFTFGQVNPFGMTMDRWFRLFTADCHSKPIYQLVRGGYYPSFGKPHDGLGFVPPMMDHLHGSTAIAGVVCYEAEQFPPEYQGNFFSGNVMTSRVNRNSVVRHGATLRCQEEPDFVSTTDPWFRPVDLCLGPDGALYIADFYNRIIGHYEVPLDHPGRDRTRGRIWRVRYVGSRDTAEKPATRAPTLVDLSQADVDELLTWLAHPNLTCRLLATDELSDRVAMAGAEALERAFFDSRSPTVRVHSLWVLFRLGRVPEEMLLAAFEDREPLVRAHAARVAAEMPTWTNRVAESIIALLRDPDAQVQCAAADALGVHPQTDAAEALLRALATADPTDSLLIHTLRIALRNQCRDPVRLERLSQVVGDQSQRRQLVSIAAALHTPQAAQLLLDYVASHDVSRDQALSWAQHIAECAEPQQLQSFVAWIDRRFADDVLVQLSLAETMERGLAQRTGSRDLLANWAARLAGRITESLLPAHAEWTNLPASAPATVNPWVVQVRPSVDGKSEPFLCSLPRGESLTGCLRSREFVVPTRLTFFMAGHDGFPHQPPQGRNLVRLCQADTGVVLQQQLAPGHDVAQPVVWDLTAWQGQRAYVELVDADDSGAYAWLAVGRFEPPVVQVPTVSPAERADLALGVCRLVARYRLDTFRPVLAQWWNNPQMDHAVRAAAIEVDALWNPHPLRGLLAASLREPSTPAGLVQQASELAQSWNEEKFVSWIGELMRSAPAAAQQRYAELLSQSRPGCDVLLGLVERGQASARLLQLAQVRQRLRTVADIHQHMLAEQLTRGLTEPRQEIDQLINDRRRQYLARGGDSRAGRDVFRRACSACHQIEQQGAVIGPQLDGIGGRGLDRILEDLLDPHRNVDVAFRTEVLQLSDGRLLIALPRGQRGNLLVFVNEKGEELLFDAAQIEERVPSPLSLMPENVAVQLEVQEFCDLVAFLLTQRK